MSNSILEESNDLSGVEALSDEDILFFEDDFSARRSRIAGELGSIIEKARSVMSADELEAFILHYWDGFTVNEVTKILGCENITGARILIQGARRKFRKILSEEGGGQ